MLLASEHGVTADNPGGRIVLDGLLIAGWGIHVHGHLTQVVFRHCTLVPGLGLHLECQPKHHDHPSMKVTNTTAWVTIVKSITGPIRIEQGPDLLPLRLAIADSILDALSAAYPAIHGDCERDFARTSVDIRRCTVLGVRTCTRPAWWRTVSSPALLLVERRQTGCVRFCYLPPDSRTPRRYECQPDLALAALCPPVDPAAQAAAKRRVRPLIESEAMARRPTPASPMIVPTRSSAVPMTGRRWARSTTCSNPSAWRTSSPGSTSIRPPESTRASSFPLETGMTPDISRDSFDPQKRFTRVIQQQGRVQLDSDWNEQADILLTMMCRMFVDLVGPHAAPPPSKDHTNFLITAETASNTPSDTNLKDLKIGGGRYYVDGIGCDNKSDVNYSAQPSLDVSNDLEDLGTKFPVIVYLDIWEQTVTVLDDADLREPALGGPDTTARTKVVWVVRAEPASGAVAPGQTPSPSPSPTPTPTNPTPTPTTPSPTPTTPTPTPAATTPTHATPGVSPTQVPVGEELASLSSDSPASPSAGRFRGYLRAQVTAPDGVDAADRCATAPMAKYRGTENQLYRVEIHSGGQLTSSGSSDPPPTFKWSRDNGAVAFLIKNLGSGSGDSVSVTLQDLGRDSRFGLDVGDWVEIVFPDSRPVDPYVAPDLLRVSDIDPINRIVTLARPIGTGVTGVTAVPPTFTFPSPSPTNGPLLRRWDQRRDVPGAKTEQDLPLGVVPITVQRPANAGQTAWADDATSWFDLEDGIQIQFQRTSDPTSAVANLHPGDYWLIPARTASNGQILWNPDPDSPPVARPPHGAEHHYAPLAVLLDPTGATSFSDWVLDRRSVIDRGKLIIPPPK